MPWLIAIIDYGMGNLRSVFKAVETAGGDAIVTSEPEALMDAGGVIIPGVGAFAQAMENLERLGLDGALGEAFRAGKPILGICLGFQLLFALGFEGRKSQGLGFIPGSVRKFSSESLGGLRIPHIGWNQLRIRRMNPILEGIPDGSFMYFAHSYRAYPEGDECVVATTDYGEDFPSVVALGNAWGLQFHPEKSSLLGLRILRNFVALARAQKARGDADAGHPSH